MNVRIFKMVPTDQAFFSRQRVTSLNFREYTGVQYQKTTSMKKSVICLFVLLCACGAGNRAEELKPEITADGKADYATKSEEAPAEEALIENQVTNTSGTYTNTGTPLPEVEPKLIRTGDLRFQVENLEKSTDRIEMMAKKHGAFISNSSMNSYNGSLNNMISIRVPSDKFDALFKEICTESIFMERKNVNTQDVTEEWVDIETRLKTKKEVEARYIEILRTKAKSVEDVLKAEEQIRIIREEIEAREGRLKYLKNQVTYSTITLEMFQQTEYREAPAEVKNTFGNRLGESFEQGWDAIVDLLLYVITGWPLILFLLLLYFIFRKSIRNLAALARKKMSWK